MTLARSPTASSTARNRAIFSASVVVGDSPVVPDSTKPSQPESTGWVESRAAASVSSDPSGLNGVTMAVSTVPNRAVTSNPLVLTANQITRSTSRFHGHIWPGRSSLRGERGRGHLSAVGQCGDLEIGENRRSQIDELSQALDRQLADLDVGVLAGPHRDEMSPRPIVSGHQDARLGSVRQ